MNDVFLICLLSLQILVSCYGEEFNQVELAQFLQVLATTGTDQWQQVVEKLNQNFPLFMIESSKR